MEQPKKERTLTLLTLLLQKDKAYSVTDLAKKLEVDRRTIYRYLSTFNSVGLLVQTNHHHVRLATNTLLYKELSDLLYFSEEEALTLYNAIESIETDTAFRQQLKAKLATIYGTRLVSEKLMRLEKNHVTKDLMTAIAQKRQVVLEKYSSPHSNTMRDRHVEPFLLSEDKKSLWAYEISSQTNKLFLISRIRKVTVLPQVWLHGRLHRQGFTDVFRIVTMSDEHLQARLILNRRARNLMVEEYPLSEQYIRPIENTDRWEFNGPVASWVGIGRFLMGLADCIEVLTPELQDYLRRFAFQHILGLSPTDIS